MHLVTFFLSLCFLALLLVGLFEPKMVGLNSRIRVFFVYSIYSFIYLIISLIIEEGDAVLGGFLLFLSLIVLGMILNSNMKVSNHVEKSYEQNAGAIVKKEEPKKMTLQEKLSTHFEELEGNGYIKVRIKGTSFRNLKFSDIGVFKGKAIAEKNNRYDDYAIAIYNSNNKHIGYAPANNVFLHEYITMKGGCVDAYGYINGDGEEFWGDVYIEFDEVEYSKKLPIEAKTYATPNLKMWDIDELELPVKKGIFEGKAKTAEGRNFPIEIYDKNNEKIGTVIGNMHLYYTLEIKNGGETEAWGMIKKDYAFVYIPVMCGQRKIARAKEEFYDMYRK